MKPENDERPISAETNAPFLTDVLTGVLKHDYNEKEMYAERIEKREGAD